MIGTLMIEPNGPGFVIVNVPPCTSSGTSFLERARVAMSLIARPRPTMFIVSAPFTTGTISPSSSATAMPRFTKCFRTSWSSRSSEFTSGKASSASHTARATKGM